MLVQRIHASGHRGVIALTGGGSEAISDLLTVPGASRCILEATVPYSAAALSDFLGTAPEKYCAASTARAMAMTAFWRAVAIAQREDAEGLAEHIDRYWGIAATASLKTDRPKRGEHRLHIGIQTASATETISLQLQKDARSRSEEERLAADLVLYAVAVASSVDVPLKIELLPSEKLDRVRTEAGEDWRAVMLGDVDAAIVHGEGELEEGAHTSGIIFPGAFHPLHHGHRRMAAYASQRLGAAVEFEISIDNVDKPPLDYTEICERLDQFHSHEIVWLSRAATFVEKAKIFPGCTFVVGADTVVRIAEPRYYASSAARDKALAELARLNCRFLVFGRLAGGEFKEFAELPLPEELRELCDEVAATEFREDISSTELRQKDTDSDDSEDSEDE